MSRYLGLIFRLCQIYLEVVLLFCFKFVVVFYFAIGVYVLFLGFFSFPCYCLFHTRKKSIASIYSFLSKSISMHISSRVILSTSQVCSSLNVTPFISFYLSLLKKNYFYLSVILEVQYNINYYFFSYILSINFYNSLITLIFTHKLRIF